MRKKPGLNSTWRDDQLAALLAEVRAQAGPAARPDGGARLPAAHEAVLQTLTEDVIKSSEIEGEILDKEQVRSSIARRLGMDIAGLVPADRDVEGVVEMMLDATQQLQRAAHRRAAVRLACGAVSDRPQRHDRITVGAWRDDARTDAGRLGPDRHAKASITKRRRPSTLDAEMKAFLDWFNDEQRRSIPVLKAGVAHLWFVTIHPFEDGNGRIARAIADMALARSENSPQRFYSMSAQIRAERNAYYRHARDDPEGRSRHHGMADMVSGMPGSRVQRCR